MEIDEMNSERIERLEVQLREVRERDRSADLRPLLRTALQDAMEPADRAYVLGKLAGEYHLQLSKMAFDVAHRKDFEEAESVIRDWIMAVPKDPYPWLVLAEHFHYYATDLDKALTAASKAAELAEADGSFVRQANGTRIRIALQMHKYKDVAESLSAIINTQLIPGAVDVAPETDFLKRIPEGSVDPELIKRYREICRA
jgi:hypothetical protein